MAHVFPNLERLALSGRWALPRTAYAARSGNCGCSLCSCSDGAAGAHRGNSVGEHSGCGELDPDSSPFASLGPAHLPRLRQLELPSSLGALPGISQLSNLHELTLRVVPPRPDHYQHQVHAHNHTHDNDAGSSPLPPDLWRLPLLSCLTLEGGASDPADWAPALLPLARLARLRLRRHTVALPGSRNLFSMSVLDGLDLDLARRTLGLDASLQPQQLGCCVRLCERILADRAAARAAEVPPAAAGAGGGIGCGGMAAAAASALAAQQFRRGDRGGGGGASGRGARGGDSIAGSIQGQATPSALAGAVAAPVSVAATFTEPPRRVLAAGMDNANARGGRDLGSGRFLEAITLSRLDVCPASGLHDDLAFLERWLSAPPAQPSPPAAAADSGALPPPPSTAAPASPPRGRFAVRELKISWFETAAILHRVLALTSSGGGGGVDDAGVGSSDGDDGGDGGGGGGALRLLELWCSGDSEVLLRRLLRDLTPGALPAGLALPRSVVLVTREGLDDAALSRLLRHCPELRGVLTARQAGGGR